MPPPGPTSASGRIWSAFRAAPVWLQVPLWGALLLGALWLSAVSGAEGVPVEPTLEPASDEAPPLPDPAPGPASEPDEERDAEPDAEPDEEPEASPGPEPAPEPDAAPDPDTGVETWTVTNIVDGDTVDVRAADGTQERVRMIGIDTPERGECGFGEASEALADRVMGEAVTLTVGARDDRDRYDRILRYVDVDAADAGLELIELGLATARYDSRDGYGRHPREDAYVAAAAAMTNIACEPEPERSPTTDASAAPPPSDVTVFPNCDALNQVYPGGVARTGVTGNTVSGTLRPFGNTPVFDDPLYQANTGRDGDGDGIACEQ